MLNVSDMKKVMLAKCVGIFGLILMGGQAGLPGLSIDSAAAGDLRAPFDFETTAVLPQGVRNPRFKNLYMSMDEKFGGSGGIEPLGNKLNKPVSWQDVIDGQSDPQLKALTQGKVQSLGFKPSDLAGSTSGVVNTYVNVKVPVLAVGLTDRLTMAVAVPIITVQANADSGLVATQQGQDFIKSLCASDPDKCQDAAKKLNDAVNTKLVRLGYDPIKSNTHTDVGDIKVVSKYQLLSDDTQGVAVKGEVTLPTGVPPNANKALDTPTGDGQWDVGATVIYDRFLDRHKALRANFYAGYTAQLPDHIEKRLPKSEDDSLSGDKEVLARDLGDVVSVGSALVYEFPFGLNMAAGYGFQRMGRTSYSGSAFDPYRYSLLEENTMQILHAATFGLGFSSVEMYKNHTFKAPFQVNLAYSMPLAGVNVVKNDFMSFEIVLFF